LVVVVEEEEEEEEEEEDEKEEDEKEKEDTWGSKRRHEWTHSHADPSFRCRDIRYPQQQQQQQQQQHGQQDSLHADTELRFFQRPRAREHNSKCMQALSKETDARKWCITPRA
jgi:hypothetical protein